MIVNHETINETMKPVEKKQPKRQEDKCKEFQALKYKTMITTGNNIESKIENEIDANDLESFLESEKHDNIAKNAKTWYTLSKGEKMKKLCHFIDHDLKSTYQLNESEVAYCKRYFNMLIDRKRLNKNTEIVYNEETGEIMDILIVSFDTTTRKFTLNKTSLSTKKKSSSLKSSSSANNTSRKRSSKNNTK